ncbi:MAG: hypothetical protein ABSB60_11605 [Terracidiphilus sp.]|jgi:hypothetical protein
MATRSVLIARIVGLCIYVGAFFLPAVREMASPGNDAPMMLRGSRCAWVTLVNTLNREMWNSKDFLAVFSGWINPLLVLYLIFLLFPVFRWPRRVVAAIIMLFLIGTWVFFALYPLVPLVGHFLWVAGILLLLSGEIFARKQAEPTAA